MNTKLCESCGKPCRGSLCRQCSNRINLPAKGRTVSQETRDKTSKSLLGNIPWNKGVKTGEKPHNWNGGRNLKSDGYVELHIPDHPNANNKGYVLEHVYLCAKALGRPLESGMEPHHVNKNRSNNTYGNLVLCQDRAYHTLLHMRTKALKACGNPNWRKCEYCKQYDDPSNLVMRTRSSRSGNSYHHASCRGIYRKQGAAGFQCETLPFEH